MSVPRLLLLTTFTHVISASNMALQFPEDFLFGVGSSSYQVEGAYDKDGKGVHIWDRFVETHKNIIVDQSDGKDACKSYEYFKEDVKALKELKVHFYRFSISWCRICPNGDCTKLNEKGIEYYNNLIDLLIENGIEPAVTLYHWELPQTLQDLGGWTNPNMVDFFEDFARIIFKLYGDRVKWWFTINEPHLHSIFGYAQSVPHLLPMHAPGGTHFGISEYLAGHTLLLAHARVYRMYKKEFFDSQQGKIGIVLEAFNYLPASNSSEDIEATKRAKTFEIEWFMHPIFSETGDYPPLLRQIVDKKSAAEGRSRSRLPYFSNDEIQLIKGSSDFLGLNHYTTYLAKNVKHSNKNTRIVPSYVNDGDYETESKGNSVTVSPDWIKMDPEGFHDLLKWIKTTYGNPTVFITENGCGDDEPFEDNTKLDYHKKYLGVILKAIHEDGCKIIAYAGWSLLDSFEWTSGYTEKFGFYHVDFTDPERKRTPKKSAGFYRQVIEKRSLDF